MSVSPGDIVGRLTVVAIRYSPEKRRRVATCDCSCGNRHETSVSSLKHGRTKSCGCLLRESTSKRRKRHGLSGTRTWRIWQGMRSRCKRPSQDNYKKYGARGITVCERWESFDNFLADMGVCPSDQHTIERKDGSLPYEPSNCVWATYREQANNTKRNVFVEHEGRRYTIAQLARKVGMSYDALRRRIRRGQPLELAIAKKEAA